MQVIPKESYLRYSVELPGELLAGLEKGASVSIDGVCQTVVAIEEREVFFDAIGETLSRTTLDALAPGREVNIERAAKLGDEIGGHLLSGHIFGTAVLQKVEGNIYTFSHPHEWTRYLFPKGYVVIDGTSLTLVAVQKGTFTVHLIPETLQRTTLGNKAVGERVNLEFDALIQAAVETVERILYEQKNLR